MSASTLRTIAERYARSLFALAREARALEAVEKDLNELKRALAESAELRGFLTNPLIARTDKAKAMQALAQKMKLSELTGKFLARLALNQRLAALSETIAQFTIMLAAERDQLLATVTSAQALSPTQLKEIEAMLAQAHGKKVIATARVNPELLGGLQVEVGGQLLDNSIHGKLSRLATHLKSHLSIAA